MLYSNYVNSFSIDIATLHGSGQRSSAARRPGTPRICLGSPHHGRARTKTPPRPPPCPVMCQISYVVSAMSDFDDLPKHIYSINLCTMLQAAFLAGMQRVEYYFLLMPHILEMYPIRPYAAQLSGKTYIRSDKPGISSMQQCVANQAHAQSPENSHIGPQATDTNVELFYRKLKNILENIQRCRTWNPSTVAMSMDLRAAEFSISCRRRRSSRSCALYGVSTAILPTLDMPNRLSRPATWLRTFAYQPL